MHQVCPRAIRLKGAARFGVVSIRLLYDEAPPNRSTEELRGIWKRITKEKDGERGRNFFREERGHALGLMSCARCYCLLNSICIITASAYIDRGTSCDRLTWSCHARNGHDWHAEWQATRLGLPQPQAGSCKQSVRLMHIPYQASRSPRASESD